MTTRSPQNIDTPVDPLALRAPLDKLLKLAKSAGADAADCVATHGRSLSISVRSGEIEDVDSSEGRDVGLRVMVGGRQACVSSSDISTDSLISLADRAVAMARLAPEDPYCGLADPDLLQNSPQDLDLFDPTVLDAPKLEARALKIESEALKTTGVSQADGASSSATSSAIFFATSDGFAQGWRSSRHNISVAVIAEKDGAMERDFDYSGARWLEDTRTPEDIGHTAAQRAVARLGAHKMSSGTLPVIFDQRVAGSIIATLIGAISGPSVARGVSFLKDKMNAQIFSDAISITDDPLIMRGHGSRPWDGEGVAVRSRKIIDKGVLSSWLLNSASARQLGLVTTGHGYRGVGSPPGVASTNLVMQPGTLSRNELITNMGDGIIVMDMFGPSLNSNTGDYSVGVSGFRVKGGEIAYPVSEITVAGNLLDIYPNIVPATDLKMDAATISPSLLLGEMAIAGS